MTAEKCLKTGAARSALQLFLTVRLQQRQSWEPGASSRDLQFPGGEEFVLESHASGKIRRAAAVLRPVSLRLPAMGACLPSRLPVLNMTVNYHERFSLC